MTGAVLCVHVSPLPRRTPPSVRNRWQPRLPPSPTAPDAERLADRIRPYFGGRDVLMRGAPARVDELTVAFALEAPQPAGRRAGAARGRRSRHVQSAADESRNERRVRGRCEADTRRGVHVALRSRRRADGRRSTGGVRNASGRARARRRAERHAQADAGVAEQDLSRARPATGGSTCRRSTTRPTPPPSWSFRTARAQGSTSCRCSTT